MRRKAESEVWVNVTGPGLYTPRVKFLGREEYRAAFEYSTLEFAKGFSFKRGPGAKGRFRIRSTGQVFDVVGAPCNLPRCICDAIATEVEG